MLADTDSTHSPQRGFVRQQPITISGYGTLAPELCVELGRYSFVSSRRCDVAGSVKEEPLPVWLEKGPSSQGVSPCLTLASGHLAPQRCVSLGP
ncbi:unnamed protein product [Lota lota]